MPIEKRTYLALLFPSLLMVSIVCPSIARACKDRMYPSTFPVAELHSYAHAYIVRVNRLSYFQSSEQSRYTKPFSFEGTVMRTVRGPRLPGEAIHATTSYDPANARCPISLAVGKTYLLMLNGSGPIYALPRYGSLYISSDQPEFEAYVADLTKGSQ